MNLDHQDWALDILDLTRPSAARLASLIESVEGCQVILSDPRLLLNSSP